MEVVQPTIHQNDLATNPIKRKTTIRIKHKTEKGKTVPDATFYLDPQSNRTNKPVGNASQSSTKIIKDENLEQESPSSPLNFTKKTHQPTNSTGASTATSGADSPKFQKTKKRLAEASPNTRSQVSEDEEKPSNSSDGVKSSKNVLSIRNVNPESNKRQKSAGRGFPSSEPNLKQGREIGEALTTVHNNNNNNNNNIIITEQEPKTSKKRAESQCTNKLNNDPHKNKEQKKKDITSTRSHSFDNASFGSSTSSPAMPRINEKGLPPRQSSLPNPFKNPFKQNEGLLSETNSSVANIQTPPSIITTPSPLSCSPSLMTTPTTPGTPSTLRNIGLDVISIANRRNARAMLAYGWRKKDHEKVPNDVEITAVDPRLGQSYIDGDDSDLDWDYRMQL